MAKITKDELIAILIERGHHRPALSRMKRDDLAALAEDAESHDVLASEEASLAAEQAAAVPTPPAATGDLQVGAEEAQVGDVWGGRRIVKVQTGPRWTYFRDKADV